MSFVERTPEKSGSDPNLYARNDTITPHLNISRNKRRRSPMEDQLNEFREEIRQMFRELKADQKNTFTGMEKALNDIQKTNRDIEKSIEFISKQYEEMRERTETLEQKCKLNLNHISILEERIEDMQRNSRMTSLEIRHLPAQPDETKNSLSLQLLNVAKLLKFDMATSDVREVFRIPGKMETNKPIIVELSTTMLKQKFIKAVKSFNQEYRSSKLNASHFGMTGNTTPVYVTEHLTSKANRLYFMARDLARTGSYKFCWSANGKIFIRKAEGTQTILIKSEDQIMSLRSTK